jgi:epoxyqueuosine reductase
VGVFGKNTALITPGVGSYTFLAGLLVAKDLPPDSPRRNPCGSCTLCLEACPTGALTRPFELDSRRCISYWTIEHRGPIPDDLAARFGDRVFGCDACLEVCPFNARPRAAADPALAPRADLASPDLGALARLDEPAFRARFAGTALARPGREGLARNAVVALSNSAHPGAREALRDAARDPSPVVREQAARSLTRHAAVIQSKHVVAPPT